MKRFFRSQQGSVMPFVAMGIVMLVTATGAAVDMGRAQIVQTRMQTALDAAGLAVGSSISTVNLNSETNKYFYANFPSGYLGTTITSLTASANSDNSVISLAAGGTVPTSFMQIVGINTVPVAVTSQITRKSSGMELVLVIDNTGSMSQSAGGSTTKLAAAKTAAISLLDIVYGASNNTVPNLWVGLVPFSNAVNIGTSSNVNSWLDTTYAATLNWGTTSWAGCVEARTNGSSLPQLDISDDPPSVRKFRPYYSACNTSSTYGTNAWFGTNASRNNCSTGSGLQYKSGLSTTSTGPNLYCPQPLTPLGSSKSNVVSAINNMNANGNTHISLGLAWAWRLLSPRWQGLWGGEMNSNNLPLTYNTPLMYKVVVLMTDGDNTLTGSSSAGNAPTNPGLYSAFGFPNQNWLSVSGGTCTSGGNCSAGETELDNRTKNACSAMKGNGNNIIIYTIALGTSFSSSSRTMLSNCASKPEYYFESPTTNQLQGIFQQIGDSLANLRVSK